MSINLKINPKEWQKQPPRWGHPMHSMCSYMASFPPKVPHYFIDRFTNKGDLVLDPFSGRGTTPTEACLMGRMGVGSDLNPIASVLTKAKVQPPKKENVLKRLTFLESKFRPRNITEVPDKIKKLYSTKTLQQLLFFKDELNIKTSSIDNIIMAVIMGGMHGDSSRPTYMSIPMPNTFSMSPNYVKNYIIDHKLQPPTHDAFDVIKHRLERIYKEEMAPIKGKAYLSDVRNLPRSMNGNKADLIFTSPPYLKVIKYGKLNWIRLWMLDVETSDLDKKLDDKHTLPKYTQFMKNTINTFDKVMKEDALCFIVVGQVTGVRGLGKGKSIDLGTHLIEELKDEVNLNFIDVIDDKYDTNLKVSRIWGEEKKGRATKFDQILILCKDEDEVAKKEYKKEVNWNRKKIMPHSQTVLQT